MPQEIILEDGTRKTVYEESEVTEFKTAADKGKEYETKMTALQTELGVGEGETIEQKLAEMKENANPNFAKFRTKFNAMEKELTASGKKFNDNGDLITEQQQVSREEIEKHTTEAVAKALSTKERETALSQFVNPEEKKLVEHYLSKLEVTGGTLEENLQLAVAKAFPDRTQNDIARSINVGSGGAPRFAPAGAQKFSDTDEGKAMLGQIIPTKK